MPSYDPEITKRKEATARKAEQSREPLYKEFGGITVGAPEDPNDVYHVPPTLRSKNPDVLKHQASLMASDFDRHFDRDNRFGETLGKLVNAAADSKSRKLQFTPFPWTKTKTAKNLSDIVKGK